MDHTYKKDFKYKHDNPYHDKLEAFSQFVMRDEEAEVHQGNWNQNVFKRDGRLLAEIGTGYGHFMLDYCRDHADHNFIGMDYRFKRSFNLARKLAQQPHDNFRYLRARGERIEYMFNESELDGLFYFFPDPWPKARHLKKRLFQRPFIQAASKVLKPGATLWVKTDHDGYAEWMEEVIKNSPEFECVMATKDLRVEFPEHFLSQYMTKFEKIFVGQNIPIKAFELKNLKG